MDGTIRVRSNDGRDLLPKAAQRLVVGKGQNDLLRVTFTEQFVGETAMVGTETQITMTDKKSPTTLRSRELLSLKLEGASWKIVAVRWQSAPAEDAPKD